jgi:predicted peptidase
MKHLRIISFAALLILVSLNCSEEKNHFATGKNMVQRFQKEIKIVYDSNYLLYLPDGYEFKGKPWPLVMFLHGSGERGTDIDAVKRNGPPMLVEAGKKFHFILLCPQCQEWIYWDNKFLMALLDEIESKYNVDKNREYLTGLSMGGNGTWSLAIEYPERFAAIAPISASGEPDDVCALKNVPVWVFHGEKDDLVPIKEDADMVNALKQCGGDVKFTIYSDVGHGAWVEAYNNPELYDWLLSHSREEKHRSL